jgi:hypothetical protein
MKISRLISGLLLAAVSCGGARLDEALETLRTQALVTASETLDRRALEAVVRAVDPTGMLGPAPPEAACEVRTEHLAAELLYVRIAGVSTGCAPDVVAALAQPAATNGIGVILDFRGAGGTGYAAASRIATVFSGDEHACLTLYDARGKPRPAGKVAVSPAVARPSAPVMLLADHRTRGAAEVLVAALQRQSGVILIGARTAGDWLVRETVPLPDGNVATVATGFVALTGDPPSPPAGGVDPHIAVSAEQTEASPMPERHFDGRPMSVKARADRELMLRVSGDPALRRATEILLGLGALDARRFAAEVSARTTAPVPDASRGAGATVPVAPADEKAPDPEDK